jgi:hypothetical protein
MSILAPFLLGIVATATFPPPVCVAVGDCLERCDSLLVTKAKGYPCNMTHDPCGHYGCDGNGTCIRITDYDRDRGLEASDARYFVICLLIGLPLLLFAIVDVYDWWIAPMFILVQESRFRD